MYEKVRAALVPFFEDRDILSGVPINMTDWENLNRFYYIFNDPENSTLCIWNNIPFNGPFQAVNFKEFSKFCVRKLSIKSGKLIAWKDHRLTKILDKIERSSPPADMLRKVNLTDEIWNSIRSPNKVWKWAKT